MVGPSVRPRIENVGERDHWEVLLLEDDAGDAALLRNALRRTGRDVTFHAAEALEEAVDLLARTAVDVAVVDLGLPDAQGLEVVDRLRASAPEVPLVVLTGLHDRDDVAVAALQRGAQDYLVKGAGDGYDVERALRFAIERQRVARLVATSVLQREALARIEAHGRDIEGPTAFLDAVVAVVAEVLPGVRTCVQVRLDGVEVADSSGGFPGPPGALPLALPMLGLHVEGALHAMVPGDGRLPEFDRTFLARVADVTTVALDAHVAHRDLALRARQFELLYELSGALVGCRDEQDVFDRLPPLLQAAAPGGDAGVELMLEGQRARAGTAVGAHPVRADVVVDGEVVGHVALRSAAPGGAAVDGLVLGQVAGLVASWFAQRRAERDRDEGRRQLDLLLDQLPAVVWSTDLNLRVTSISGSGLRSLQAPPAAGDDLEAYLGGADALAVVEHRKALSGVTAAYSFGWDGAWWEVVVTPLRDRDGTVAGVLGVGIDATDVRRVRHEADEQRRRYEALFEHSLDAIVLTDAAGRFTDVNPAMCALVGRSRDDLLGLRAIDLAPTPEAVERFLALRSELLEAGELRASLAVARPDGTTVDVEFNATAQIRPGTNLAVLRDVTSTLQSERLLRVSEQRFRTLAEHAVEGIFRLRLGPDRGYEYVNPALERITGFTRDEVLADDWLLRRRTHPGDVVDDTVVGPQRLRFQRADGAWRWLELRQAAVTDDDGTLVAVQGLLLDVTDAKRELEAVERALQREQQATEQLRRVDELKDGFLRATSHELRTPLTAILGFASTLRARRAQLDPDQVEELLGRVEVNAERLRELLDDLLDIDRLTAGDVVPHREAVDLADLARTVCDEFPLGHRTLTVDLEAAAAAVERSKVERILHNLLSNAVKHTPNGTTVAVATRPTDDGGAVLVVEDDGPGIDPGLRERLFEPFAQGQAAAALPKPGTGIGLSLAQQFARLHGGEVVAHDRPGGGARFEVVLPPTEATPR